jgi:hypothetical protein
MNRKQRRAVMAEQHTYVKQQRLSNALIPIPLDEFPPVASDQLPELAWRSNKYLVQLWDASSRQFPDMKRLSVSRVRLGTNGTWQDGLTWDELMACKRETGFGEWWAVEIYPQDSEIVNVASFRHLWLLPLPLPIGWFK